jgi:hypothetical protein
VPSLPWLVMLIAGPVLHTEREKKGRKKALAHLTGRVSLIWSSDVPLSLPPLLCSALEGIWIGILRAVSDIQP